MASYVLGHNLWYHDIRTCTMSCYVILWRHMYEIMTAVGRGLASSPWGISSAPSESFQNLVDSVTNSGCHALNDDDVAADLPLQLTLRAYWWSCSGCAPSCDPPPNRDVVCCRTSDDWQRCPWQSLCQGHSRELRLEGSLAVSSGRCSSSGTYVIWQNILVHGPLITYKQDVTASLCCTPFTTDDSWLCMSVHGVYTYHLLCVSVHGVYTYHVLCVSVHGVYTYRLLCVSVHGVYTYRLLCVSMHGVYTYRLLCVSVHGVYTPILNNWQDTTFSMKRSTASKVYVQHFTWYSFLHNVHITQAHTVQLTWVAVTLRVCS